MLNLNVAFQSSITTCGLPTHGNDLPRKISGEMNSFMEAMIIQRVDHALARIQEFGKEFRGFFLEKKARRVRKDLKALIPPTSHQLNSCPALVSAVTVAFLIRCNIRAGVNRRRSQLNGAELHYTGTSQAVSTAAVFVSQTVAFLYAIDSNIRQVAGHSIYSSAMAKDQPFLLVPARDGIPFWPLQNLDVDEYLEIPCPLRRTELYATVG